MTLTLIQRRSESARKAARTRAMLRGAYIRTCARCDQPRLRSGGYCRDHNLEYQRAWREQRREHSRETTGIVAGLLCEAT